MFVLLKDVYIWGAPQGGPIGGEGCRHRSSEAQGECLAPAGAFLDRDDHHFPAPAGAPLEKMGGLMPSSQRRASWPRAECDMI